MRNLLARACLTIALVVPSAAFAKAPVRPPAAVVAPAGRAVPTPVKRVFSKSLDALAQYPLVGAAVLCAAGTHCLLDASNSGGSGLGDVGTGFKLIRMGGELAGAGHAVATVTKATDWVRRVAARVVRGDSS